VARPQHAEAALQPARQVVAPASKMDHQDTN
jgi:hypothetical protein